MRLLPKGFTMLEITLCIGILALLVGWSVPAYQKIIVKNDIDTTQTSVVRLLYQAQTNARAALHDSSWGVYANAGQIILFSGDSFTTRDTSRDHSLPFSTAITSSDSEIIFEKMSGFPQTETTLTLTSNANQESHIITINEKGTITY